MALGIYKPGQGYWVRVLTATFVGVLFLAGAAWLWDQLEALGGTLPKTRWEITVSPASGAAAPGQTVVLLGEAPATGAAPPVGTGTVVVADGTSSGGARLVIDRVALTGASVDEARSVAPAPGSPATLSGPVVGRPQGTPLIDPLYIQAGGVGLLLLLGAMVTYWVVGVRASTVEFLIATDGEMKKVNWSTRRDVIGSTWVVILWSAMIAAGLFVVDLVFSKFFLLIGVLQQ
ncbi:MAG: preprotein translocase subunit SecE [Phycisphaerales bacterium]